MKCIECKHAEMRGKQEYLKCGLVLCAADKLSHDFKSLNFDRECASFDRLDQDKINARIKWQAGEYQKLQFELRQSEIKKRRGQ